MYFCSHGFKGFLVKPAVHELTKSCSKSFAKILHLPADVCKRGTTTAARDFENIPAVVAIE